MHFGLEGKRDFICTIVASNYKQQALSNSCVFHVILLKCREPWCFIGFWIWPWVRGNCKFVRDWFEGPKLPGCLSSENKFLKMWQKDRSDDLYSHYLEPCNLLLMFFIYIQVLYGYQAPCGKSVDHNIVTLIPAMQLEEVKSCLPWNELVGISSLSCFVMPIVICHKSCWLCILITSRFLGK